MGGSGKERRGFVVWVRFGASKTGCPPSSIQKEQPSLFRASDGCADFADDVSCDQDGVGGSVVVNGTHVSLCLDFDPDTGDTLGLFNDNLFCKTRGDPYDVVVKGVLILAAVHLGAAVSCDLDPEYAVHTWDASLALLHDAGLCLDVPTVAPFLDYS